MGRQGVGEEKGRCRSKEGLEGERGEGVYSGSVWRPAQVMYDASAGSDSCSGHL